jgi:hypothetical protein
MTQIIRYPRTQSVTKHQFHATAMFTVLNTQKKVSFNVEIILSIKKLKLSHYTPRRRLGERRYSSYSSSTSTLDGGQWSASRPGRALPPGKIPPVHIVQEAGWAPEPVWTQRLEEKSSAPAVFYLLPFLNPVTNPPKPVPSQVGKGSGGVTTSLKNLGSAGPADSTLRGPLSRVQTTAAVRRWFVRG